MKKVTKNNWKTIDISLSEMINFNREISENDLNKIIKGFLPKDMEDKWFIYFENNKLYFSRSWSGYCIFILTISIKNKKIFLHDLIYNSDSNQNPLSSYSNFYYLIVNYLIDSLLLKIDSKLILSTKDFDNGTLEFIHGIIGNTYHEDRNKNTKPLKIYNSEINEIFDLFSFRDYLEETKSVRDLFEDDYNLLLSYTKRMEKWFAANSNLFSNERIIRYIEIRLCYVETLIDVIKSNKDDKLKERQKYYLLKYLNQRHEKNIVKLNQVLNNANEINMDKKLFLYVIQNNKL